jgi:hypothetical protein
MKRKNRRLQKKRLVHSKKLTRIAQSKRKSRKLHRIRRKKLAAVRRRQPITDPRVARGLGQMRREGISASEAAKRERMKLRTFRKGAGRFLYRSGPGKPWKARSEDQLSFFMTVLTRKGRVDVIVRNSRERKLLHEYESAVRMFRAAEDGAEEELKKFEGKTVGGYELITDIKMLIELEEADELDFESLYSPVGGRS